MKTDVGAVLLVTASWLQIGATSSVWTVNCRPLTEYRADPILNPDDASTHVHAVVGGTGFSRYVPDNTAVESTNTTCDKYTDHSMYWAPSLYYAPGDGSLLLQRFQGAAFYYQNSTCDYDPSGVCPIVRQSRPFPPGFRMIAGDSRRRTFNESNWPDHAVTIHVANQEMSKGFVPIKNVNDIQARIDYPMCWDGENTWLEGSAHVVYPDYDNPSQWSHSPNPLHGGMCPESHPKALIHIGGEYNWALSGVDTTNGGQLVFSNGDSTGYGFHADFLQGWTDPAALEDSFANCAVTGDCLWRTHGNPTGGEYNAHGFEPETPAIFEESIGVDGPLRNLPGPTNDFNCVYDCAVTADYCC